MKSTASHPTVLSDLPIAILPGLSAPSGDVVNVDKAGIIPLHRRNGEWNLYLMKPRSDKPELGDPGFQVCKGTRETDSRGELERLIVTALREGQEEIGLKPANVIAIWDSGIQTFASASTGNKKYMQLFLAIVRDPADFDEPDPTLARTADRQWFATSELDSRIRSDFLAILQPLLPILKTLESPTI